ncbi:9799_t:CDS:2 [Funneliformis mosseae]|uniref:9799_t:CDS:1 n=1 Tax=Funneliformis mosseae TaxID=27381 RepID=A0A9N9FQ86_FUNMO|nr:9799_t:CDS:2 [Funneliformis mosseae]
MAWDTWEKFVANYEIFCNNLLFELEQHKEEISLKKFYREAIGKGSVLNIQTRLEKLELCEAKNQFPKTGLPINRLNNRVMNLDGLVIINGYSAPFGDIILLRKKITENRNLLIVFQQKWYITLKELTIDDIKTECNKNKNAINEMKDSDLKKFLEESHIMTVIFTSQLFKGNPKNLLDDYLIISIENFNHTTKVIEKNPTYRSYLEKVRTQLEDCSYASYSFLDNENDSIILNEYDSYLNDNDIEMDVDL